MSEAQWGEATAPAGLPREPSPGAACDELLARRLALAIDEIPPIDEVPAAFRATRPAIRLHSWPPEFARCRHRSTTACRPASSRRPRRPRRVARANAAYRPQLTFLAPQRAFSVRGALGHPALLAGYVQVGKIASRHATTASSAATRTSRQTARMASSYTGGGFEIIAVGRSCRRARRSRRVGAPAGKA